MIMDDVIDKGTVDGKAAASWVFEGNTSIEQYKEYLRGVEEGDPEILDKYPAPNPLSGEWAGGLTAESLAYQFVGETYDYVLVDEIASTYEVAFENAYYDELERIARLQVAEDETRS